MPNQDALTLAKVAIEAQKRYCEVYVPSHYREHGLFGKSGVLISPEDFIAAAIDRHMEVGGRKYTTWDGKMSQDWVAGIGERLPMDKDYIISQSPLYRITQEPRGGEDGED